MAAPPLPDLFASLTTTSVACPVLPVLQEVEKQYKEGTLKHAITRVLIAVRPEALTAQGEPAHLPAGRPSCVAVPSWQSLL